MATVTTTTNATSTPTAEETIRPTSASGSNEIKTSSNGDTTTPVAPTEDAGEQFKPTWRFWLIFVALAITAFLASLEGTIVSTALPTINAELNTGDSYIWVINAFFLTSAAFQPLYGQFANIFGRRWVMIVAVAIFILGSGIGGGARSPGTLIAARAVQGTGSGGMVMMLDLIVSDLVPVRQRGAFMGVNFAAVNIGTALGPFVGGIIVQTISWRWVFWINLPIGGFALLIIVLFLNTTYRRELVGERLRRLDFIGNAILIASTVSILFALTYGGTRYAWSHFRIVVPLVLGFVGYILFVLYEAYGGAKEPVAPLRLFASRTSAAVYFITFIWSILSMWRIYWLSAYFQGARASSPARAGVQLLPSVLMLLPAVAVGGGFVKKTGRYKPIHIVGLALTVVGHGLYTILSPTSSTATWVILQIVVGFFSNLLLPVLLPSIQATLPEKDTAAATAFWGFLRSFGIIFAVTIPASIFNNRFDSLAYRITDTNVRNELINGRAYEHASKAFITSLQSETRGQVTGVFSDALKRTWQVSIAFAGVAFLVAFLEREVTMRTTVDTEYGLKEKVKESDVENTGVTGNKAIAVDEKEKVEQ